MVSPNEDVPALERFQAVVHQTPLRLDVAALLISAHCSDREVDVEAQLGHLDALAERISEPTLDGVLRLLFRDLGFAGDSEVYYDPANSYLDQVIERRGTDFFES